MSLPPYMRRQAKEPIGRAGRKSEQRIAKEHGKRLQPGSGSVQGAKGDIDLGAVLLECKSTTNRSFGIRLDELSKIAKEARDKGKIPALAVSFVNEDGKPAPSGEWVLIPHRVFKEIVDAASE